MAKGWTTIRTDRVEADSKEIKVLKDRRFKKAIKNTQILKVSELKEISQNNFDKKIAREESLLQALKDNKLKSARLIAEAEEIKISREKSK